MMKRSVLTLAILGAATLAATTTPALATDSPNVTIVSPVRIDSSGTATILVNYQCMAGNTAFFTGYVSQVNRKGRTLSVSFINSPFQLPCPGGTSTAGYEVTAVAEGNRTLKAGSGFVHVQIASCDEALLDCGLDTADSSVTLVRTR